MLGTRGCRLGLLFPEISEMQVRAIMRAAAAVRERSGEAPHVEVMVPLVAYVGELDFMRKLVIEIAEQEGMTRGEHYSIGTMIELPRACVLADKIAGLGGADFFSFGTNDLSRSTRTAPVSSSGWRLRRAARSSPS
jgi:pyruvate, orthophosphate dikinase